MFLGKNRHLKLRHGKNVKSVLSQLKSITIKIIVNHKISYTIC